MYNMNKYSLHYLHEILTSQKRGYKVFAMIFLKKPNSRGVGGGAQRKWGRGLEEELIAILLLFSFLLRFFISPE